MPGLNLVKLPPGGEGAPPHCHSAEDKLVVALSGEGTLHVEPTPVGRELGRQPEEHDARRGHVVSFPAGSALCHSFAAGDSGLSYLAYGTREPTDVIYYPRRSAMYFRGAGVILPAESIGFLET